MAVAAAEEAETPETRDRYLQIAVRAFERLIIIDPSEVRPRLELGRVLFLLEEDSDAEKQFEKALAGDLPVMVKRNIVAHLDTMQQRKRWFATLSVALAADDNIGAVDDGDTLYVGPFLFRLDNPAKRESGIGLHTWANGQYFHPLRRGINWRSGAELSLREYSHRRFDTVWLGVQTGPQLLSGPLALSLLAEAGYNRRAGRPESYELGFRLDSSLRVGQRLTLYPHARRVKRTYRKTGDQDGQRWSLGIRSNFRVTPRLTVHGGFRYSGEHPERRDYRSLRRSVDLGSNYDLPSSITVRLDVSFANTRFKPHWGFLTQGEPERKDRLRSYRFSLVHHGWTLRGFTPRLSVTRERRKSNAQLQGFERWQGQIAFVKQF